VETIISKKIKVDTHESGVDIFLVEVAFDLGEYLRAQVEWAINCPINKNGVREKMGWSDEELNKREHRSIVFAHFVEKNGNDWFHINLRPQFHKTREKKLENVRPECLKPEVHQNCQDCSECPVRGLEIVSN